MKPLQSDLYFIRLCITLSRNALQNLWTAVFSGVQVFTRSSGVHQVISGVQVYAGSGVHQVFSGVQVCTTFSAGFRCAPGF